MTFRAFICKNSCNPAQEHIFAQMLEASQCWTAFRMTVGAACMHTPVQYYKGVWKTRNSIIFAIGSHASTIAYQIIKTPSWNKQNLSANMFYNTFTCKDVPQKNMSER